MKLRNNVEMPQIGLGVYKMTDEEETYRAIQKALEVGYRMIDTASFYGNEEVVGRAIRESNVPREEIFVVTKIWNDDHGYTRAQEAIQTSLNRLGLDYVDALLVHWPVPGKYVETYEAVLDAVGEGLVRVPGVSNHTEDQLTALFEAYGEYPVLNQVEYHPYLQQEALMKYCNERDIKVTAWSPIGRGKLLNDPIIQAIASEYGVTPAQVILRWHLQEGRIIIPKSVTPSRIAENFDLGSFELADDAMTRIQSLSRDGRTGANPYEPDFMNHFK